MSGRCRTVSRSALPRNRPRASRRAASTPNGRLQITAQVATRRLSQIAWTSSGRRSRASTPFLHARGQPPAGESSGGAPTGSSSGRRPSRQRRVPEAREDPNGIRRLQVPEEAAGIGMPAGGDGGGRKHDRRVALAREGPDYPDAIVPRDVGGEHDPHRRLTASYHRNGRLDMLDARDPRLHGRPDAEPFETRATVSAGRMVVRMAHDEWAGPERRREWESWSDAEGDLARPWGDEHEIGGDHFDAAAFLDQPAGDEIGHPVWIRREEDV